ncbi:MAG: pilus (MSHA type) biogenesis protein MshL [Dissulfuribacterales bacterium]
MSIQRLCSVSVVMLILSVFLLAGCVFQRSASTMKEGTPSDMRMQEGLSQGMQHQVDNTQNPTALAQGAAYKPGVEWRPSYAVSDMAIQVDANRLPRMKVGADIHTTKGKVPLNEAIKRMADLKGLNVSWNSDVNQTYMVDVHVNADDDYWAALSNILRQLDYGFELQGNTIVVRYKETRKFYLSMPFISANYRTATGGDMLGGKDSATSSSLGTATVGKTSGLVALEHKADAIDLWASIEKNLDKILKVQSIQVGQATPGLSAEEIAAIEDECIKKYPNPKDEDKRAACIDSGVKRSDSKMVGGASASKTVEAKAADKAKSDTPQQGDREGFFYTIDRPLGIITVTAPKSLLDQVDAYVKMLKAEMSRQVVIEAKILEVTLNTGSERGVDWTQFLNNAKSEGFNIKANFGNNGMFYPHGTNQFLASLSMDRPQFTLLLDFLNNYGNVRVLSNPKLSMLNGQPAMITVGNTVKYIDEVKVNETSSAGSVTITYDIKTANILSGIGLSVMASIQGEDEVLLHITPITTELQEPIEYKDFTSSTGSLASVGLPRVAIRELTTMARVKNGEFLIVGGLIDKKEGNDDNGVPLLEKLPLIGYAFKHTREYSNKRELIILLRPEIINL